MFIDDWMWKLLFFKDNSYKKKESGKSQNLTKITLKINPLTDDKILDGSKLKQITDNILKCI